eukprot:scaffold53172_cov57-Phaeocystis_antarctica.AAC.1
MAAARARRRSSSQVPPSGGPRSCCSTYYGSTYYGSTYYALGATEWSASLLLRRDGEVAAIAAVEYTYDAEEYVWPHARERKELRRSHATLPAARLQLFQPSPRPQP